MLSQKVKVLSLYSPTRISLQGQEFFYKSKVMKSPKVKGTGIKTNSCGLFKGRAL